MRKIFYMLHSILLGLFLLSNIVTAETLVYYHNDQIGNPIIATDQAGNKLWEVEYTPYGEPTSDVSELDNDYWFGAKPYDEDTKLSHQGDRHYQVQIGRFLSIDPLDFNSDNILTFNRYAYGNNNPYKYNDPTGNAAETPWDVLNVTISAASFSANITSGNFLGAAIDAVGIGYDLIATAIPGLPAGGGTGIKAARAADTALEASQGGKQVGKSVVNAGGAQSKVGKAGGGNNGRSGGLGNGGGSVAKGAGKPDFIVSPKGTTMPTNKDFNLVDSNKKGGDWFQIHNKHTDAKVNGSPHTHYPKQHGGSRTREIKRTDGGDLDRADRALRNGTMRERRNRGDKGG